MDILKIVVKYIYKISIWVCNFTAKLMGRGARF
ncbi:hypothetical protein WN943_005856 [Citrus x changshan-huyou]